MFVICIGGRTETTQNLTEWYESRPGWVEDRILSLYPKNTVSEYYVTIKCLHDQANFFCVYFCFQVF